MHVVQIWIMHIKYLENPINVWKCPNEPRNIPKLNTTIMLFYVDTRNFLKEIRGNGYRFVPKGGTFPTENHHACCEKLRFVRSIYPNLPQMGQNVYHDMLMPLHDSMPSLMNFRRVLDLLEFKTRYLNVLPAINSLLVFEIHSHFLHGT